LTAYCERLEVENVDRANTERKRVTAYGLSIVNGAQTLGSIAVHAAKNPRVQPDGFVFIKIISLRGCPDDQAFAVRITQSTNFQNQITSRDFVALEEEQDAIANGLAPSGICYHYRDGDDTPAPDGTNFTLEEATTAMACLEQQNSCDLLSRIVAQRKALWSFEEVYPSGSIHRSRYAQLFKNSRTARSVWRAVQVQRVLKDALKTTEKDVRKDFFENGRWLVLNVIFLRLHLQDGESLALTPQEISDLTRVAQEYAEHLWSVCQAAGFVSAKATGGWETPRHFRSVFSASGDCQTLKNGLMARLDRPAAAAVAAAPAPAPANPNPAPPTTPAQGGGHA